MGQFHHLRCQNHQQRYMYLQKTCRRQQPHCVKSVITTLYPVKVAQNLYKTLTNIIMVKTHEDPRVKVTLGLMENNPKLKLPQAMRAAEFTIEESKDPTLQMRVRRRQKKELPTSVTVNTQSTASVSTLSTLTSTPLGKIKKVRHTSHAAQQKRQNKKINERKRKEAFKMATTIYEDSLKYYRI